MVIADTRNALAMAERHSALDLRLAGATMPDHTDRLRNIH